MTAVQEFLQNRVNRLRVIDEKFSYRRFSLKAGFGSPNYLLLVIQGKRRLSIAAIEKFARGLDLDAQQAEHFKRLVIQEHIDRDKELQTVLEHVGVL